jgi:hypothetical protein
MPLTHSTATGRRSANRSLAGVGLFLLVAASVVLSLGCADTSAVRRANLDGKLPDPDAAFMKRVESDPFPNATSVPKSSR